MGSCIDCMILYHRSGVTWPWDTMLQCSYVSPVFGDQFHKTDSFCFEGANSMMAFTR